MNNRYKGNWIETQENFCAWWEHRKKDRPLMRVVAKKPDCYAVTPNVPNNIEDKYLDANYIVDKYRAFCENHIFLAEAFPYVDANLGPGSMALYLGSEPVFTERTVWYKPFITECGSFGKLEYSNENKWWQCHLELLRQVKARSNGDFMVSIPDIIENLDILASLRDAQELCYDIADYPEQVKAGVERIDELYFTYYDAFYDVIKEQDDSSCYTAFAIWGPGRTAKLQCDFSAMISPICFRELVQESLRKQCKTLNNSLYHLDGVDAIRHLDALMEIKELNALQWTSGAGQPDGVNERWYPIYDKVIEAKKSLWINVGDGNQKDWRDGILRLTKRYGNNIYFMLPVFETLQDAQGFVNMFD